MTASIRDEPACAAGGDDTPGRRAEAAGQAHLHQAPSVSWLHIACSRRVVRRAIPTALVVGTILTAINQGGTLVTGDFTSALLWHIPLTYCVPYLVTTWGALGAARGGAR